MKTWKFFLMAFAALAMACGGDDNGGEKPDPNDDPNKPAIPKGEFVLSVTPGLIKADGVATAQFTATLNGQTAVEGLDIVNDSRFIVYTSDNQPIDGLSFSTTEAGSYTFWAAYGTNLSNRVTITATEQDVPELPADPNPSSTDFVHRALYTVYTGSGCMYCPYMTAAVHTLQEDEAYADKFVMTACHAFSPQSPAYCDAAMRIGNELNPSGSAPVGFVDLAYQIGNTSVSNNVTNIKNAIDSRTGTPAKAGISAVASQAGEFVIVRAAVKAAEAGQYRVNAWLLEDGIYAAQAGDTSILPGYDFNTHNNVIRLSGSNRVCEGNPLGQLAAGAIGEQMFVMPIDAKWNKSNLRVVVYVCAAEGNNVSVANVIVLDPNEGANEAKTFEYAN